MASMSLTGFKMLRDKLKRIGRRSPQIIKTAMVPSAKVVAKAIKKEIPSSWKGAKKTIGWRVNKPGRGRFKNVVFAKAGAGVGMSKKRRGAMNDRATLKGRGKRKGVGIGVGNIMWFLEGTNQRWTGTKRARRGMRSRGLSEVRGDTGGRKRYTGRLKVSGIVQTAYRNSQYVATRLIVQNLVAGIVREAMK